jgi:spoIIIJ-associated protein
MAADIDVAGTRVHELLERIIDAVGVDATVHVEEDADEVRAQLEGDDLGLIIGRHGQMIDAIQHIAYRIACRGATNRKRVVVDAAGYRERRAVALRAAADQAAEAAVHDRRPVTLEAMTALERKVVHEHLKTRHDVETYSEGEEPDRRLVVAPLVHCGGARAYRAGAPAPGTVGFPPEPGPPPRVPSASRLARSPRSRLAPASRPSLGCPPPGTVGFPPEPGLVRFSRNTRPFPSHPLSVGGAKPTSSDFVSRLSAR